MISIIAAVGKNGELGKNNNLIWHLPGDLQFFKEITINHKIIMGYNTYMSIGHPLPQRQNIVLVKENTKLNGNLILYNDINKLINEQITNNEEVFIIGGASLYNYFYPLADKMYLTLIDAEDMNADVYFPKINYQHWQQSIIKTNEENNIKYKHVLFERTKNE